MVEDNPGDVTLVREALDLHGVHCDVIVMGDGEKALKYIEQLERSKEPCPELVVLDLNLPRKSGREVLARIRTSAWCANIPVVILSSSEASQDREETARLGASRYIRKPSSLEAYMEIGGILKQLLSETC